MEVGSKYFGGNREPSDVGRVSVSVAATGDGRRKTSEPETTEYGPSVMTRRVASTELRTSGEGRLAGTSRKLDTAAERYTLGYELGDGG
jgi:hypothetical protein